MVELLSLEQPQVKVSTKPNNKTIKSLGISKKAWNHARNLECLPNQQESLFRGNYFQSGTASFFFFNRRKRILSGLNTLTAFQSKALWFEQTRTECHTSKNNQKDKKQNSGQNSNLRRLALS